MTGPAGNSEFCIPLDHNVPPRLRVGEHWGSRGDKNQAYCTLRNETKRNEICTLRNENLYFAKWKSVLCEVKSVHCEVKSVHCEMKLLCEPTILLQSWPRHTFFLSRRHRRTSSRFFVDRDKAFLTWYLESADLENSERKPVKLRPSGCLEKLAPRKKTIFP